MKFVGVRNGPSIGDSSVVGVAVPESGYAGEGDVECAFVRASRMPDRIAMPSVPQPRTVRVMGLLEGSKEWPFGTRSWFAMMETDWCGVGGRLRITAACCNAMNISEMYCERRRLPCEVVKRRKAAGRSNNFWS